MTGQEPEVLVEVSNGVGRLTLNRPKAINALNHGMVRTIADNLSAWADDDSIRAVVVSGAGERGLCAGGDIVSIYHDAKDGGTGSQEFWRDEYILNAAIGRYPKPYVAIMDGIVMGGGVGLASHGSHRIATDQTRLAMPETGIGFFPDVGGTYLLSRAPGELGTYFGLTGTTMNGFDAVKARFADVVVSADRWQELRGTLTRVAPTAQADEIARVIAAFAVPSGQAPVAAERARIDRLFSGNSAEEIVAALEADGSEFAAATLTTLRQKSPTSVKVTLRLLRQARDLKTLEQCLVHEYRASLQVFVSHEFLEGVRAAVIDKDRNPKWSPARIEDVTEEIVARYFEDRGADELRF